MFVWAALFIPSAKAKLAWASLGCTRKVARPTDVCLEKMHAGVGCVPGFDDDVVEFVAQELVDDALILAIDFEEVGQRANSGHAVGVLLVGIGLEDVADRVGGIAVLFNKSFKRVAGGR